MATLGAVVGAVHLLLDTADATTAVQIGAARALDINVADVDVLADGGAGALQVADQRVVLLAGGALEVLDCDVGDGEVGGELVAQRDVFLAVALRDLDGVVDVLNYHAVVGDVGDFTGAASTLQIAGQGGQSTGPDLDACAVGGVGHGDVGDVDVLDDVDLADVLSERANRDTVGAVADEVLNDDVGRVWLERDAVVTVVDVGVLDDNVVAAVCVPAVSVLGGVAAHTAALDVDVGEHDVSAVGDESVPLRAVTEFEVGDHCVLKADGTEQNGA